MVSFSMKLFLTKPHSHDTNSIKIISAREEAQGSFYVKGVYL